MTNSFTDAALFLTNTLFDLFLFVLMIRLILAWVHADYFNPVTQMVVKLTQFFIQPLRRIIPNAGKLETATLVVIFIVEILKFLCITALVIGAPSFSEGVLVLAFADILKLALNTLFYAILLQAILSWVQPGFSPMGKLLTQITSPIMRPIQRVMPPVSGFDLSPIPAMIILQLLSILLVSPIFALGTKLTFG